MHSLAFLSCVCYFVTGVTCNYAAGPFQSVYVWYAYQMDVSAHGVGGPNGIAIDCRGSNSDGSCKFDELMKHLHKAGKNKPIWKGSTDIGGDFFPDPVHAAEQLVKNGFDNNFKPEKLFPNLWPAKSEQQLSTVLSAVTDRIQAARQRYGDDFFTRELKSARTAISIVLEARLSDQADYRIPAINEALRADGITWTVETETRLGQESSWRDIDILQTLRNHPKEPQKIIGLIENFETNWTGQNKKAMTHDRAIKACQAVMNRVFGGCNG